MASSLLLRSSRSSFLLQHQSKNTISRFFAVSAASSSEQIIPGVGKGKTSTGLVGLPVDHDAVSKIITKYTSLLQKAQLNIPPNSQYRIDIEKICTHRINAAQSYPNDPEKVEEICNCGQVEELVEQADDEMEVMDMYIREKWWEKVKEVEIETDPAKDSDGGHGDVEWDKV